MASKVELCNTVLTELGASTITALSDSTEEAIKCNTLFDVLAKQVMSEGSWTSTIRRAELARITSTPSFGYSYIFQLPEDPKCLKVLNINDVSADEPFEIEDDKLLTDLSTCKIRYIAYLTDTEDWDIYLEKAFLAKLKASLSYTITGSGTNTEKLELLYEKLMSDSLALNGQQGSKDGFISDGLTRVR